MATLLYRIGRYSFRNPKRFVILWFVVMLGILGGGSALGGQTEESFAIPGTESQEAIDRLAAVFPQTAGASSQVVVLAPDGETVDGTEQTAAIEEMATEFGDIDGVDNAVSPFSEYATNAVSDDERAAIIQVQFAGTSESVTDATLEAVREVAQVGEDAGLTVQFGGQVFQDLEYGVTPTEIIGVLFAGVVLLITFGSLLAAGMPLLSAIIGVGVALGGVIAVSAFTTISSATPLLALMIGLAVGIDYALFILSRHRNQLANGMDPEESAATAVATAGSAVVFAGVTVIIALLGLLVVGIPFLSAMGVSAAGAVLVAILVSLTMLPAMMGLAGRRLAPKPGSRASRRALAANSESGSKSMGARWVALVMKAPIVAVIAVVGVLGTLAIPAFSLTLALPDGATEPAGSTAREAYDLITEEFGPGYNGPLVVLVDITQTTDIFGDLESIGDDLKALDDVDFVSDGIPNPTVDTAIIQVIPSSGPSSPETTALVQSIRDLAPSIEVEYGTPVQVTGATAVASDISSRLNGALIPFGVIVVGLSIVLLMMVFRSILVPLKAAAGFLLSVLASFGAVVAIFQWGWFSELFGVEPGPILSFMPILLMAVLFGLAMDYEVFLVSGMREEFVHNGNARRAVARGFTGAARVVTAAALIMFFVFFAFVPEGAGVIKTIAFGLAVGIAADAFLVRMTLVPAVMTLAGRHAWYLPKWLARLLPNVDIEGESLKEHTDAVAWAARYPDEAITASYLVAGSGGRTVGPIDAHIPVGAVVLASGDAADRRLLAATLAGRLAPVSGHAQVGGHPLPSEASRVSRLVALADLGATSLDDPGPDPAVGELLAERLRLLGRPERERDQWLERVNRAVAESGAARPVLVHATSTLVALPQFERAVTLAAVALAERAPIVMLDQLDAFADVDLDAAFLRALDSLAPRATTLVLGTPLPERALPAVTATERPVVVIDLYSLEQNGVRA